MRDPSQDVGGCGAAAELVVSVPEGRLVLAAECLVGQRIEHRFDLIKPIVQLKAQV